MSQQPQYFGEPESTKRLGTRVSGCGVCPLNNRINYRVNSFGDPRSPVWWVGEAPGKEEGESGEPFLGKSGKFHWRQVALISGRQKESMYTGNIVRCWPEGNRTPTKKETQCCIGFLEEEIRKYKPVVIGALGAVAFQALTGRKDAISDVVGQEFIRKDGVKVIALYHPSYGLRMGTPPEFVKLYGMHVKRVFLSAKSRGTTDFAKMEGYVTHHLDRNGWWKYQQFITNKIGWCSIDIETSEGKVPYLVSSAYGTKVGVTAYFDDIADLLKLLLEDKKVAKVFQNGATFDIPSLETRLSCIVRNFKWDTFIAGVTLDSRKGRNNLTRLTEWALPEIAGYDGAIERYVKEHPECKEDYSKIPPELLLSYAGYDAISTAVVYLKQEPLANVPLVQFYMDLLREVLGPMERMGIPVDVPYLRKMIDYLTKEVENTRSKIRVLAKDPLFNPASSAQVAELLFNKFKLSTYGIKKSEKTGNYSVDKETMARLSGSHRIVDLFGKLRSDEKLLETYAERILREMRNERFHVKYWIGGATKEDEDRGAETGRLSSTLQNIPRVDKDNPRKFEAADIFIPSNGNIFLVPDYSQAELRALAVIAHERRMIADFKQGYDAHTSICYRYLDVPEGTKPSKNIRVVAKAFNFAKVFGATAPTLAKQVGKPVTEILKLFQQDMAVYPDYWSWRREQVARVQKEGCAYTMFGFRRPLNVPDYYDYIELELEHWMKQALNTPVQGTAGQIMLLAMLIIKRMNLPCLLKMNIHDSAPIEVAPKNLDRVAERVKYAMEVAVVEEAWKRFKVDLSLVPWVAELEYGDRLSALKELKVA
jgi:uracil-DNA glycosylase